MPLVADVASLLADNLDAAVIAVAVKEGVELGIVLGPWGAAIGATVGAVVGSALTGEEAKGTFEAYNAIMVEMARVTDRASTATGTWLQQNEDQIEKLNEGARAEVAALVKQRESVKLRLDVEEPNSRLESILRDLGGEVPPLGRMFRELKQELEEFDRGLAEILRTTNDPEIFRGLQEVLQDLKPEPLPDRQTTSQPERPAASPIAFFPSADGAPRELDPAVTALPGQLSEASEAANRFGLVFVSAFEDAIIGGRGLGEVFQGLEQDIIRLIARMLVLEPILEGIRTGFAGASFGGDSGGGLEGLVSGGIKGALELFGLAGTPGESVIPGVTPSILEVGAPAFLAHAGGVVGHLGAPSRFVSFADVVRAERFHDGGTVGPLPKLPGERVILARDGETIRTPEQERALQSRGGSTRMQVVNNFAINGAPADRRTQDQIARAAMRGARKAQAQIGS